MKCNSEHSQDFITRTEEHIFIFVYGVKDHFDLPIQASLLSAAYEPDVWDHMPSGMVMSVKRVKTFSITKYINHMVFT